MLKLVDHHRYGDVGEILNQADKGVLPFSVGVIIPEAIKWRLSPNNLPAM